MNCAINDAFFSDRIIDNRSIFLNLELNQVFPFDQRVNLTLEILK